MAEQEYINRVPVVCHLCGETWLYPPQLAKQFDADHPLECAHCKKRVDYWH